MPKQNKEKDTEGRDESMSKGQPKGRMLRMFMGNKRKLQVGRGHTGRRASEPETRASRWAEQPGSGLIGNREPQEAFQEGGGVHLRKVSLMAA